MAGAEQLCGHCVQREYAFDRARSYGAYEGTLRELIHLFKYRGMRPLARPLSACLVEVVRAEAAAGAGPWDAIVAVPLAPGRERERGYNQARLLAAELARAIEVPVIDGVLRRVRATPPQTQLTRAQRLENLRGAFAPGRRASRVDGRGVLLVDDVFTTGATLSACARVLRQARASRVTAFTVARTPEG